MKLEFDINQYFDKIKKNSNQYFHTFINKQSLAAGVLLLHPSEKDTQTPHDYDEIYYIIKGNGFLKINKKDPPPPIKTKYHNNFYRWSPPPGGAPAPSHEFTPQEEDLRQER